MSSSKSLSKTLKIIPVVIAVIILLLQTWLILKNKQVFKNSEISIHLSSVQASSHSLYSDLVLLRDYLTSQDNQKISEYIQHKMPLHKQWLKEIIFGQNESHPLVIFSEKYLRLLKGLRNDPINEAFSTRLDLLELVDSITQEDGNISILSKQRMVDNFNQLKDNIITAELISVLTIILFVFYLFSNKINHRRLKKNTYKTKKLSLFFIDYPNAIIRLSTRGNVRYYNKKAASLMRKYNFRKDQLVPSNIDKKLDKIIKRPNQIVRFSHVIGQTALHCDIRLCADSGQIYMMISEVKDDPIQSKPLAFDALEETT